MLYILCDHKLGNALIIMATYFFFKNRGIDVTYVMTEKNINLLDMFPNIDVPYIDIRTFDASTCHSAHKHVHMQLLDIDSLVGRDVYVSNWYAQRMEYIRDTPLRSFFRTRLSVDPIHHTVVHIRTGDIDHYDIHFQNKNTIGKPKHHFPVPVQVYDAILQKDEPVTIVTQTEDNKYVRYLKERYNIVRVVCSGDDPWNVENKMVEDFATLQACTETLILSCSTFAWCAGMASNAKRIIAPSQGYWHHSNRDKIDLYPEDDRVHWFDVSTLTFI